MARLFLRKKIRSGRGIRNGIGRPPGYETLGDGNSTAMRDML